MRRGLFFVIAFVGTILIISGNDFSGLCGASLKEAVKNYDRPNQLIKRSSVWAAFRSTDCTREGSVLNRFSTEQPVYPADGSSPAETMQILHIVDETWWFAHNYGDTISMDLHNIYPCSNDVYENKCQQVPGYVMNPSFDSGKLRVGIGYDQENREIAVWEPEEQWRGDVARVIFYMATLYPATMWGGEAANFLTDTKYPTLNQYAVALLLDWHRNDPVSEVEKLRNDAVERFQGNRNVFVDNPELVESVWGYYKEDAITPEEGEETPEEGDETPITNPKPLKARYSIAEERIDLYTPFVSDDAAWMIDGQSVGDRQYLIPSNLGIGKHELRYAVGGRRGKIIIEITQ